MQFAYKKLSTPLGSLLLIADDRGVALASFRLSLKEAREESPFSDAELYAASSLSSKATKILDKAERALKHYFKGKSAALDDIPVHTHGTTFQKHVWRALDRIPAGQTRSYGEIAKSIRKPKAVRAVGTACGANPAVLFTPCHRVIGKDKSLTGFSAGLSRKRALLELEGSHYK